MQENEILDIPEAEITNLQPASNNKRFLNFVIDTIIIYILIFAYQVITMQDTIDEVGSFAGNIASIFINMGIQVLYFFLMENAYGKTIGKYLTRTKVLNMDGSTATSGTIFKRSLCRLIPFDAFSFLGSRGWHDSIPDVIVIDETQPNG